MNPKTFLFGTILTVALLTSGAISRAEEAKADSGSADARTLVEMPSHMQAHMLGNMRDHLHVLDDVLAALANGNADEAGKIVEQRLGMSSLDDHGAAHLAMFMPKGMQAIGTELHHAASRFAQAAANADVEHTFESQQAVFEALQGITVQCNACHDGYRIR
ncbi:cytochrome c [Magnetovibrio blakemorei]|uniref:Cytochrome C n=1 Tax=Magnetovibrio blakemorei TaxID=28181 RepID=A0A1E5QB50_9PROT|nr:cytochrome c [Magnetovibrio blakemorei]OEJ69181.1 hypothetical protein BEN30_03550 [Magnetovibrio blakemorei]